MDLEQRLQHIQFRASGHYGKDTCVPGWRWKQVVPFHDYTVWFVLSGQGEVWVANEYFRISRGSLLLMRPGELHNAAQNERNRLTNIFSHFTVWDLDAGGEIHPLELLPRHVAIKEFHLVDHLAHRLLDVQEFSPKCKEAEFDLIMKLIVLQLFQSMEPEEDRELGMTWHQKMNIKKIIRHIRMEDGREIDYRELSRISNMSPQYLNRIFKKFTGVPLKQFIIQTKLERAVYLLSETTMSVSEIADSLGYSDIYSFSKFFKKFKGMSPSHFRHALRNPIGVG